MMTSCMIHISYNNSYNILRFRFSGGLAWKVPFISVNVDILLQQHSPEFEGVDSLEFQRKTNDYKDTRWIALGEYSY
ncbi:hypothetical protein Y032_0651g1144 [Ancylostoma ceylanicum]|uniref:Uncharacterized protein n=1 Tax=Ancylostoma ceylanicum TaxID=53326 RepID=A0A016WKN0_9BILA|nr:hypothetical protein Y032_0651g1144 [Ancylostoma ceylanicum]